MIFEAMGNKIEILLDLHPWTGHYRQLEEEVPMELYFKKTNDGSYHGLSQDKVGFAVWVGLTKEDGVELKKRYIGQHSVLH